MPTKKEITCIEPSFRRNVRNTKHKTPRVPKDRSENAGTKNKETLSKRSGQTHDFALV